MLSVTCLGFSSLAAIFAVRASCRLPQLRCWVAPSSKAVCPARPATPLLLPPLLGKPTACSTWPLFLSNFAGASPSKMLRASRKRPFRPLAQRVSAPLLYGPHPAPEGTVCAGPSAISVYPSNQPCYGPCRPGPRRPSALHTCWRSLPAAGSLGSPVRGTVKARQRLTLPDRLRGHPPLPLVAPGPWWFRDSKAGARNIAVLDLNDITRAIVHPLRL